MTSNTAADPGSPRPFDRRWLALGVIAVAQLMTALDATIVNIALPSAQRSLAFDDGARQWVVTVPNTPDLDLVGVPIGVRRRNPRSNVSQRPRDYKGPLLTELETAVTRSRSYSHLQDGSGRVHQLLRAASRCKNE